MPTPPSSAHDNLINLPRGLVQTKFDRATCTLWISMHPQPANPPNFSRAMLCSLQTVLAQLERTAGIWNEGNQAHPIEYAVLRSNHARYFSLGGDLEHFQECITHRDADRLRYYSTLCLDMMYAFATKVAAQTTTVALVQGRTLGGGFETALAADYIVAEEHAMFGLPEITFGLFPCTGAMSLLARRVGLNKAEEMTTSGQLYSATELYDLGIVDVVCEVGAGEQATRSFILKHSSRRKARRALRTARRRMDPLQYSELSQVVEDWVETAMRLDQQELRYLDALVRMQRADLAH
jgi:DSF synthase